MNRCRDLGLILLACTFLFLSTHSPTPTLLAQDPPPVPPGEGPLVVLTGPTENTPGNLVVVRTEGTVGKGHRWMILPESAQGSFFPVIDAVSGHQCVVFSSTRKIKFQLILAVAQNDQAAIGIHTIDQTGGDDDDVDPDPDDEDDDDPDPPTPPGPAGLHVLILEETAQRGKLPSGQLAALLSTELRSWLNSNAQEWHLYDDDYTDEQLSYMSEPWRAAYKDARSRAAGKLPWIHLSDGQKGYSGPLPGTLQEIIALLEKYK